MMYFLLIIIALLLIVLTGITFYIAGKQDGYNNAQRDITSTLREGYITLKNKIYTISEFKTK